MKILSNTNKVITSYGKNKDGKMDYVIELLETKIDEWKKVKADLVKGHFEHDNIDKKIKQIEDAINILKTSPAFSEVSRPLLNSRYIVRDWMTACVDEYDNYEDAKRDYDILFESSDNGKEECDISLYQVLHEFNNVD